MKRTETGYRFYASGLGREIFVERSFESSRRTAQGGGTLYRLYIGEAGEKGACFRILRGMPALKAAAAELISGKGPLAEKAREAIA